MIRQADPFNNLRPEGTSGLGQEIEAIVNALHGQLASNGLPRPEVFAEVFAPRRDRPQQAAFSGDAGGH